jgi:hypothetical protein
MAGSCSEAAAAPRRMDNDELSAIRAAGYTSAMGGYQFNAIKDPELKTALNRMEQIWNEKYPDLARAQQQNAPAP